MLKTADGQPLAKSIDKANKKRQWKAFFLTFPLLVFLFINFLLPIGDMMLRSIDNTVTAQYMPKTIEALKNWDGEELPDESVFAALAQDFHEGAKNKTIGKVGKRLNFEKSGMSSLFRKTSRKAKRFKLDEITNFKETFIDINKDWEDINTWRLIHRESGKYTSSHLLSSVDFKKSDEGNIEFKNSQERIHVMLFWRTIWVSALITLLTVLLGYPIAYLMANISANKANLLMILVLLPFWTSLLVRTSSWIAILQTQGVLNDLLVWSGIISEENRIQLVYNMTGTFIAMTHILLPFMVLPLYSVMKTIPQSYTRAATSMGASKWTTFWKVYMPQTISGIGAGGILVFILAIGYYITPALVGGRTGVLISNIIAYHMQGSLNWGLASALGVVLLVLVTIFYSIYNKFIGIDKMKLG